MTYSIVYHRSRAQYGLVNHYFIGARVTDEIEHYI